MEENEQASQPKHVYRDSNRTVVLICYVLGAVGIFSFLPVLIALIVCYVKRDDALNTIYQSHYSWLISTFWIGLFWLIVSFVTLFFFGLGWFIYLILCVWLIYRFVKGILRFAEHRAIA